MLIGLIERLGFRGLVGFYWVFFRPFFSSAFVAILHAYSEKDLPALRLSMEMGFEVNPYFEETFLSTASPSFSPCSL